MRLRQKNRTVQVVVPEFDVNSSAVCGAASLEIKEVPTIREEIRMGVNQTFGGDPKRVTVFGESLVFTVARRRRFPDRLLPRHSR
jgi:hypothetical protein